MMDKLRFYARQVFKAFAIVGLGYQIGLLVGHWL